MSTCGPLGFPNLGSPHGIGIRVFWRSKMVPLPASSFILILGMLAAALGLPRRMPTLRFCVILEAQRTSCLRVVPSENEGRFTLCF